MYDNSINGKGKDQASQNHDLLKENKELKGELKLVNKKLQDAEALKSHFVSNITNEIINPFTSIIGLSKSILSVKKENWKRVITMVAMINSEAFNLDFQLRNIFVAAKLEAGDISAEISKVNVYQVIKGVVDQFSIESKKKAVKVNIINELTKNNEAVNYIYTDAEKIKMIISNLLSNAIKFSNDEGLVEITAGFKDEQLYLVVKDEGTGISEANQKIIFDRFKRVDSGINSINRGHGLGLSITKALLDILDGEVIINSEKDKGAKFEILLPVNESETSDMAMSGNEFLFEDMDGDEIF